MAETEEKAYAKVLDFALCVFYKYGKDTERYKEATVTSSRRASPECNAAGRRVRPTAVPPAEGDTEIIKRCLAARSRNARSLRAKVAGAVIFLKHVQLLGVPLTEVSEWQVASWLRHQAVVNKPRGSAAYLSLRWVECSFGVDLRASSELVRSQRTAFGNRSRLAPPVPARCPTEEQVLLWEQLVRDDRSTIFVKAFAGAFCALAHGMLRWSDLQRSMGLTRWRARAP